MQRSEDAPPSETRIPAFTGRRSILRSGIWVAAGTVLPFLATAALSVVAGRVLGPQLLGQQSLIAFVGALASAVAVTSLTDAGIRHLSAVRAGRPAEVPPLERWLLHAHLVMGVAAAGVVAAVAYVRGDHLLAWAIVGVSTVLDALAWAWSCRVISREGWTPVARRRLTAQLLSVGLGIVAVVAGLGIEGIFASNAVATVVLLVLLRPLVPRIRPAIRLWWPRPVLSLWAFFVGGALLAQVTSGRIEILFLGASSSGEQIAQYTVAAMLVTSAVTLPASLAAAAMPAVAAASGAGEQARADQAVVRALRVTALLSLPLTALVLAVGPVLVMTLYGEEFREAGELSRVLAVGAVVLPCGRLTATYWAGLGRMRRPFIAGLVGAALELTLAALLIPRFAAEGAVTATLVGQTSTAVVGIWLTRLALRRRIVAPLPWCTTAVVSAAAAGAGSLVATTGGVIGLFAAGTVTVVVFVLLMSGAARVGAPVLDADDTDWLRGALPARLSFLVRPLSARS